MLWKSRRLSRLKPLMVAASALQLRIGINLGDIIIEAMAISTAMG